MTPRRKTALLHVGLKGHVLALDRDSGAEVWRRELTGVRSKTYGFVGLHRDGDRLYATYSGEVYCLDPDTGEVRWHNQLRGLGTGLVSVLGTAPEPAPPPPATALFEAHRRQNASQHGAGI